MQTQLAREEGAGRSPCVRTPHPSLLKYALLFVVATATTATYYNKQPISTNSEENVTREGWRVEENKTRRTPTAALCFGVAARLGGLGLRLSGDRRLVGGLLLSFVHLEHGLDRLFKNLDCNSIDQQQKKKLKG